MIKSIIMKKIIAFLILNAAFLISFAQAPQGFNYQAVARNLSGTALINQSIGMKISLRQGSSAGTIVYTETHTVTSNNLGLLNLVVGSGTPVTGTFNTINWANGPYFIEISMDITGGTAYALMGTQQLMSVPYALYAQNSGTPGTQGNTGATGAAGTIGATGNSGATGLIGATGTSGSNGNNGSTGATGATGTTGINGATGSSGIDGINGSTGATGTIGINGATGATGTFQAGTNTGDLYYWNGTAWTLIPIGAENQILKVISGVPAWGNYCAPGQTNCSGNCVNLSTDINNCGSCGHVCSLPNAAAGCSSGFCVIASCTTGFADCNNISADGCEINLINNTNNCGACGNVCASKPNAAIGCSSGLCVIASCGPGFADCNMNYADGCEVNITNDLNNCGACGNICSTKPNAAIGCSSGFCVIASCSAGFADCNMSSADGCEVNIASDLNNCGACGNTCSQSNATVGCSSGLCVITTCNTGFADCNNNAADGCEVNVTNNTNNCGACGNVCPSKPNASIGCSSGLCIIASCSAGFADCNMNYADGCEVNVTNNTNNCGACGNVCASKPNASIGCSSGLCVIASCNPGFADCDNNPVNGCEVNITNNTNSCGACGNTCPGGHSCIGGVCN